MKKLLLFFLFSFYFSFIQSEEKTSLFYFNKDQKSGWDLYEKATFQYLSGDLKKAINLWQVSSEKGNLHSQARLFQLDLKNENKKFAGNYQELLQSNFSLKNYLVAKYSSAKDRKKIIDKAIKDFEGLVETKDYWLLSILGKYYLEKSSKKQDILKGLKYLKISGKGNYTPAQVELGLLFQNPKRFIEKDINKAIEWLQKAVELKDKYGCLYLAQLFQTGSGDLKPDVKKAIPLYEEAFKQGVVDAAVNLGVIYDLGVTYNKVIQVKSDDKKSKYYLDFAMKHGDLELFKYLGVKYFYTINATKEQKIKGLKWYEEVAKIGTLIDKYKYADLYFKDKHVKDYGKARKLFDKLVQKKGQNLHRYHILVYLRLGQIYFDGLGVKKDYLKAKEYYDKINFTSEALERIITMYLNGWGVKQDDDMVIAYIDKLFDPMRNFGYKPAPYFTILGDIYSKRKKVNLAIKNYRLAAISGFNRAIGALIKLYGDLDKWEKTDIGDIYFTLKQFDKAFEYYSSIKNPPFRAQYFMIRLLSLSEFKQFDIKKFVSEMKNFANKVSKGEKDPIERIYIDRVLDRVMVDQNYKTRSYFMLGEYYSEIYKGSKKRADLEEAHAYYMKAYKGGYKYGILDAAKILVYQKKYKLLQNKGLNLFREEYKKKNPFAAAMLFKYYESLSPTNDNVKLKLQYLEDAKKFDKGLRWRNKPLRDYIKSQMAQIMEMIKQKPSK
ncbi:MAG: hypothetical protein COA79_18615 [Planctomycetota bacterium]|nr:MAG: hypothetical protein COA79_18615 [Planctomycetota bacterium]